MPSILPPLTNWVRSSTGGLPPTFWYLWVGIFISRIGNFVMPFLSIYLTTQRGFTISQAGLTVASYAAGAMVATLVGGTLADRIGRRRTLLLSLLAGPVFLMGLPFAEHPILIVMLTFAVGAIYELYRPAAIAAISDVVPPTDRQRAFALQYWVINLGFAIGVSLAGFLATNGYIWLFVFDALTTFLYGIVVFLKVPETRPATVTPRPWLMHTSIPFRQGAFVGLFLITLALASVLNLSQSILPIEITNDGLAPDQYGPLIALNGILIILFQPFVAALSRRFQMAHVLAVAAILLGLGFGATAIVDNIPGYAGSIALWTFAEMAWLPLSSTLITHLAPSDLRGSYQGAYGLSWAIAGGIGPSLGGLVLEHLGSGVLWGSCILIGAIAALGFLRLGPSIRAATPTPA